MNSRIEAPFARLSFTIGLVPFVRSSEALDVNSWVQPASDRCAHPAGGCRGAGRAPGAAPRLTSPPDRQHGKPSISPSTPPVSKRRRTNLVTDEEWQAFQEVKAGITGQKGETAVARQLALLGAPALHDVILADRSGLTQIDHLVLGPDAILVLETKTYAGFIEGGLNKPAVDAASRAGHHTDELSESHPAESPSPDGDVGNCRQFGRACSRLCCLSRQGTVLRRTGRDCRRPTQSLVHPDRG